MIKTERASEKRDHFSFYFIIIISKIYCNTAFVPFVIFFTLLLFTKLVLTLRVCNQVSNGVDPKQRQEANCRSPDYSLVAVIVCVVI